MILRKLPNFVGTKTLKNIRWSSSSTKREFKEVAIKVPWGHVAGKWWEPYDTRPILAIHGWQDNCQSFDRLIPMLNKNLGFLAIDLPGHGYSSRLPIGMLYQELNFILTVRSIVKYFDWSVVSLMGHSMGSIISYTYSMFYPKEVDYLICIDAMKPWITSKKHIQITNVLEKFFTYNDFLSDLKEPPSYTLDELKNLLSKPINNSILPECTNYIMERNIAPSKIHFGKYYFTRDPRLKQTAFGNYCQSDLVQLAEVMEMPIFIIKAKDSSYFERKEKFYQVLDVLKRVSTNCDIRYVEGRHHVHLNYPENISELINNFINCQNNQDRSIGGIKDDIIKDFIPSCIKESSFEIS